MRYSFVGLGHLGASLAGSLLREGFDLAVSDINPESARELIGRGARWAPDAQSAAPSRPSSAGAATPGRPSPGLARHGAPFPPPLPVG